MSYCIWNCHMACKQNLESMGIWKDHNTIFPPLELAISHVIDQKMTKSSSQDYGKIPFDIIIQFASTPRSRCQAGHQCAALAKQAGLTDLTRWECTLFITTMGFRPRRNAFSTTNLVWESGPSLASTKRMAPSTIPRILHKIVKMKNADPF